MGWIGIGFALLNTFANCDLYRFFLFFEIDGKRDFTQNTLIFEA